MNAKREGLGARFWKAIHRVIRDDAPSWQEPPLPGLAPTPIEKANSQGWRTYHAETDRIAAERLPKEMPAPVTWREQITREGQAMARAEAANYRETARQYAREDRTDQENEYLGMALDVLNLNGLNVRGEPMTKDERLAWEKRVAKAAQTHNARVSTWADDKDRTAEIARMVAAAENTHDHTNGRSHEQ